MKYRDYVRKALQIRAELFEGVHKDFPYPCIDRFILSEGIWYPSIAPGPHDLGRPGACFYNAMVRGVEYRLTYVEGFACMQKPTFDCHHAWCVDPENNVYDFTWPEPGIAYIGVPFDMAYVEHRFGQQLETGWIGSLLLEGDDGFAILKGEAQNWRATSNNLRPSTTSSEFASSLDR